MTKIGYRIGATFVIVVLAMGLTVSATFYDLWTKIDYVELDEEKIITNTELEENTEFQEQISNYITFALFGLDNRWIGNLDNGNSDCIIVVSINKETKEVKMVSVYRDTFMKTGEDRYGKANSAYAYDGVEGAINMLNQNLDLSIDEFVAVDFYALAEAIDALGGVEINVQDYEMEALDACIEETAYFLGREHEPVYSCGWQTLDGLQATGYARIRATWGDDYMRTSRQRIVIQAIMDKVRTRDASTLLKIAEAVLDDVSTSLNMIDMTVLASNATKYTIASTSAFPMELTTGYIGEQSFIIPIDMKRNVELVHEYLYEDDTYIPTSLITTIGAYIENETGINSENTEPQDLSNYLNLADPAYEEEK